MSQKCVKPRKSKVSHFLPYHFALVHAHRPNSPIRRLSATPNALASASFSKQTTKSSAYRISRAKPVSCGSTSFSNHLSSSPRAPCYIPRPEVPTNGGVNAAFRHTDNVGFQNHQIFGARNLHLSIVTWYPIPPASHQPVTRRGAGFSSEVVAILSSGWIFTSWRV